MIKFELNNSLSASILSQKSILARKFLLKIEKRNQGFYKVLDDKKTLIEIKNFAKKIKGKFKFIVVLGIGGSALGTLALQQSLKPLFAVQELYVLDNVDPALIRELEDTIDLKKTLFIVASKSGTNTEPLSQYFYFRKKIENKKLSAKNHFVFITDPHKGTLREIANREKITAFAVPENVGGRFSVLTSVSLLPAALIGIDIDKLISGAKKMRENFLNKDGKKNLPYTLALIQYLLGKKGKTINVLMPYCQHLIRFSDWHRQLLAESIGKNGIGLTPAPALGVTDQHSQTQLYNDGPNDKFFIFLEVENMGKEIFINSAPFPKELSFNKLLKIEKDATVASLTKNSRPNITIKIDKLDEESLGELFLLFEGATAFLGELYGINAYNQPGVELTKKLIHASIAKLS